MFLPTRYLVVNEGLRWAELAGDPAAILGALDYDLHFTLRQRRIGEEWIWPDGARRAAARSAGMVPDPRRFPAEPLLGQPAGRPAAVPDPLASNLRALAALTDARYVLYPLRLSFVPTTASPTGPGRAVLRLALVDVRTATVEWTGDVASDPAPRYGPALPAGIASRVADLFAPPAQ